ncbi:MAG TPA: hypothetical protein VFB34_12470 [Chloroflexota bacterium]|nr:hypothetical protein [Chloroflexota bacterium]
MKWFGDRETGPQTKPWSAITLAVLGLVFGVGALIVSVSNLEKLNVLDSRTARFFSWCTVVLLACLLLLIWSINPKGFDAQPEQALLPLSLGSPIASYLVLAPAFRRWREEHPTLPPRPWYTAVLPSLGWSLLVAALGVVLIGVFSAIFTRST